MGCLLAPGPPPQPGGVPSRGCAAVLASEKGTSCWPLSAGATASSRLLFLLCSALKTQSGAVTPPLPSPLWFHKLPACPPPHSALPTSPSATVGLGSRGLTGTPHPPRLPRSHQGQPCDGRDNPALCPGFTHAPSMAPPQRMLSALPLASNQLPRQPGPS